MAPILLLAVWKNTGPASLSGWQGQSWKFPIIESGMPLHEGTVGSCWHSKCVCQHPINIVSIIFW